MEAATEIRKGRPVGAVSQAIARNAEDIRSRHEQGVPLTRIAASFGVTRQTIAAFLERNADEKLPNDKKKC